MSNPVPRTLLALGAGVVLQRLLQLVGFVCIGRELGPEGLGQFAQGQAVAALLAVLAGAGVRNACARAMVQTPAAAHGLVRHAVGVRLRLGVLLAAAATLLAVLAGGDAGFWSLCALQVLPAAFDLKHLLDATGRTRAEVVLETGTAALQLVLTFAWIAWGEGDVTTLAGIALLARCSYALGALPTIARLPRHGATAVPALYDLGTAVAAVGQAAHELMAAADVWLVALCFGDRAAGHYAVAVRLAGAALLPSTQLARLLLPHLLRAGVGGDSERTVTTAWRTTLLATLPMCGGGLAVAVPLCRLPGEGFEAASWALVVVLLASCLQHLGWQSSHALLAAHRDRAFGLGLLAPAVLHAIALPVAAWIAQRGFDEPVHAPLFAAAALLLAQSAYVVLGLRAVRVELGIRCALRLGTPLLASAATAVAAGLPTLAGDRPSLLAVQLATGGAAYVGMLWWLELRGRWRRLGAGLAAGSGFTG